MKRCAALSVVLATLVVTAFAVAAEPSIEEQTYYQLSTYTTVYDPSIAGRTTNVELATSAIDGVVLQPGESFSFNQTVGPRTYARGYRMGVIISGGKYVNGMGGGICQVSSTLFNAALLCNMQIDERHPHAIMSAYVPAGRDATVSYGSQDFRITNPHANPVRLSTYAYDGRLSISINGVEEDAPAGLWVDVQKIGKNTYQLRRNIPWGVNYITNSTY